jgi:diacylglycerol kinase (ATP)
MPATVILNPYANRWETGRRAAELKTIMQEEGIDFELKVTEGPNDATVLASEAIKSGHTPLIAAGGDGTISEILNGLMQATLPGDYPAGPFGLLPLGTANDLTDALGIPRDLREAVRVITAGKTRAIDLGRVNGRYFGNNAAVGLEPMVTIENIRLTWMKGIIRYLASAVIAIFKRPAWNANVEWDDGSYNGSLTLVSVGNSPRTGGVFYMTPQAVLDDGLLDFIFAPSLGKLRLFQLLPKAQTGEHIKEPEIQMHRTRRLSIKIEPQTPIQADGELISTNATEILYEVLPGALQVFSP